MIDKRIHIIGKFISFLLILSLEQLCFYRGLTVSAKDLEGSLPHATIVYPGWSDQGIRLTESATLVNKAQAIIVVTEKPAGDKYKEQWTKQSVPVHFLDSKKEPKPFLENLKSQGINNVIVVIDMDIVPLKTIYKGAHEINWSAKSGTEWNSAFRSTYENAVVGYVSHSYGNAPVSKSIMELSAKADYAIMNSPQAKRTSLNEVAERTRLFVVSAEGDIGPVTWDGQTKFLWAKLGKTESPHNDMVKKDILQKFLDYTTNMPKGEKTTIADLWKSLVSQSFSYVPSYWTYSGRSQSLTEAQIMTEMVHNKNRCLIIGKGPEAELMYKNMVTKLGEGNVKWSQAFLDNKRAQLEAKGFGADVILGVRRIEVPPRPHFLEPYRQEYDDSDYDAGGFTPLPVPVPADKHRIIRREDEFPPPPDKGGGAAGTPHGIGGIMLEGVAQVSGKMSPESQLTGGTFSLIFQNSNAGIDIEKLRKFVTALWAVYFSKEGPGVSIDPIAEGADKHLVRYIGRVINSDLGRVMREADYTMKRWAVGTEKPEIAGFESVDGLTAQHGLKYLGASRRFWFVPGDMRFRLSGDALLFDSGRMTLKTEYVFLNKGAKAEPADEAFAKFFTEHYDEIADKYPIYRELFEYAKLVGLARYLKEKGIPLLWFLLSNKDMVITEDSPGTVDALAKRSDYFEYIQIEGGVDLAIRPAPTGYIIDSEAINAINKAIELHRPTLLGSSNITFEMNDKDFTLTPSQTLTLSSGVATGDKYQTDLALRFDKEPGLEVVRYYDPEHKGPATFGKGWHLMIPYKVEPFGEKKIEFLNAMIPERMAVKNLLTGREEVLTFSKDRFQLAGYVPDDLESSNIIGLFLLSDASFRLADKLGNEFQFDEEGRLTEMVLSEDYHIKFEYGYAEAKKDEFADPPYRIEPLGDEYEEFLNAFLPKNVKVVDLINEEEEVFVFNKDNELGVAGYTPDNEKDSRYTILAIMTDGSFVLGDKYGNEISFDPAGRFNNIRTMIVKGVSQGDYNIDFDYEFKNGQAMIREARVTKHGQADALYAVKYEYARDGRLSRVTAPTGQVTEIRYDEGMVTLVKG